MRISGKEPSSVILSQTTLFQKLKRLPEFFTGNFDALKRYESTEVDRRTWLHVSTETHWSTSSDTHQVVEMLKETSTKM